MGLPELMIYNPLQNDGVPSFTVEVVAGIVLRSNNGDMEVGQRAVTTACCQPVERNSDSLCQGGGSPHIGVLPLESCGVALADVIDGGL